MGIPDAGIIRADVKYVWNYQLLVEEPAQPWYRGFEGHFVRFLEGGETEMPNMGMALSPPPHIGQCTPGSGDLTFIGCADGHWYSFVAAGVDPVWEVWLEAGWAHYIFRRPFNEGDPPGPVIGEGYSYWDPARPRWGLHGAHSGGQDMGGDTNWKVIVDFVDTALPE